MFLKNLRIILVKDSEEDLWYLSGSVINGFLQFDVEDAIRPIDDTDSVETSLATIDVNLYGRSAVEWADTWIHSHGVARGTVHDSILLLHLHQQIKLGNDVLELGRQRVPFAFELPVGLATSFDGRFGFIRYTIEAQCQENKAWELPRCVQFQVLQQIDINEPQFDVPIGDKRSKPDMGIVANCSMERPLKIIAQTNRAAYCPEDEIFFEGRLDNKIHETLRPYVVLVQTQIFKCSKGGAHARLQQEFNMKPVGVLGLRALQRLKPKTSVVWDGVAFSIPKDVNIPSITSPLIRVLYHLEIGLLRKSSRYFPLVKIRLPIVIGTIMLYRPVFAASSKRSSIISNTPMSRSPSYRHHSASKQSSGVSSGTLKHVKFFDEVFESLMIENRKCPLAEMEPQLAEGVNSMTSSLFLT